MVELDECVVVAVAVAVTVVVVREDVVNPETTAAVEHVEGGLIRQDVG